ncbi:MAG: recombination protein RecR [Bacilli bacterium]|nr:recombination protein RecR [Bacilli bacterium]
MSNLKFLDLLAASFENLPGVGKKTARRYAYYIVEKMNAEQVEEFAKVLIETKNNVNNCPVCGMLSLQIPCEICSSKLRDKSKIMVLKDTKDIIAIENMGEYNGMYHSLNGLISPMDGIGPDNLTIDLLEKRLDDSVSELIIATSFTPAGETTALYLEKIFEKKNIIISRLGYGLPAGGDIEFIDELTLKRALSNRSSNKK